MKNSNVVIRREMPADYRAVEELVRDSFWNVYRPGCAEHFVLHELREDADFVPELDFVLELDGRLIGQVVYVKTVIACDDGSSLPIMTMGPLCIAPAYKRQGFGKKLLDYSLEKAKTYGCRAVCFEGDIDFYGKSGFVTASAKGIRYHGLPEGMPADFFLCKELESGYFENVTGEYATPKIYFAAEEKAEAFKAYEATFPEKKKLVLPGQLG